ncbi:hypothetical protein CI102_792 [Trichoderma harzianum]|nr:hypothetical protein CI102_792 [Trichoderma harzianum]
MTLMQACYSIYEIMGTTAFSQVGRSLSGVWRVHIYIVLALFLLFFSGRWNYQGVRAWMIHDVFFFCSFKFTINGIPRQMNINLMFIVSK